jgi:hypothetical protein
MSSALQQSKLLVIAAAYLRVAKSAMYYWMPAHETYALVSKPDWVFTVKLCNPLVGITMASVFVPQGP